MRIAGLLLCCCALLAAGCSGQDAATPAASATTASPDAALEPKIVVQLGHQSPVLAVRWVDGGRHLASLARDGSIVVWNVASGTILDHAQVPLEPQLLLPDGEEQILLLVGTLASFASWLAGMGCEATGIAQWLTPTCSKRKLYSTLRVGREALVRHWPMEPVSQWLDRLRSLPPALLNQMLLPA